MHPPARDPAPPSQAPLCASVQGERQTQGRNTMTTLVRARRQRPRKTVPTSGLDSFRFPPSSSACSHLCLGARVDTGSGSEAVWGSPVRSTLGWPLGTHNLLSVGALTLRSSSPGGGCSYHPLLAGGETGRDVEHLAQTAQLVSDGARTPRCGPDCMVGRCYASRRAWLTRPGLPMHTLRHGLAFCLPCSRSPSFHR